MRVQSFVPPNEICMVNELYFRAENVSLLEDGVVEIGAKTAFSTDTFMNLFDAIFWQEHTGISDWELDIDISGLGIVKLLQQKNDRVQEIVTKRFSYEKMEIIEMPFTVKTEDGDSYFYFEIEAESDVYMREAYYFCNEIRHQQRKVTR